MNTISRNASFSEIKSAAKNIGLQATETSVCYELWQDERYMGGFPTTAMLADKVNLEIEILEISRAEIQEKLAKENHERNAAFVQERSRIEKALGDASEAAVLHHDRVIGYCLTSRRSGQRIDVATEVTHDGQPVGVSSLKISRSQKNLNFARENCSSPLPPKLYGGNIFYVISDCDE
ncbi:hypothetical protein [Erwinia mallotivora]|uniref:hypothetical protein n=1 Tax=Erwinia mallotivora TaxID=69222 RepID=UPI0021BE4B4A|nr:hypothetical protein [Erwinia mallotivora]